MNTWEDGKIDYRWGYSILPGWTHLFGFQIHHQDRNVQWNATLESVTVHVALSSLLEKKFHALSVRGEDLRFKFRFKAKKDPKQSTPSSSENKWGIFIENVRLARFDQFDFENHHFEGRSAVRGGFKITPDQEVWVKGEWKVDSGQLHKDGHRLAKSFAGGFDVNLQPFDPKREDLNRLFFFDIDGELNADVTTPEFVHYYLKKAEWFNVEKGEGPLHLRIKIKDGVLRSPTEVQFSMQPAQLRLWEHRVQGKGKIIGKVEPNRENAEVHFIFQDIFVKNPGTRKNWVEKGDLKVIVSTEKLHLDSIFEELRLRLNLEGAHVPNLTDFNAFIGPHLDFKMTKGMAEIKAELESRLPLNDTRASMQVKGKGVGFQYNNLSYSGDFTALGRFERKGGKEKYFEIAGSELNVTLPQDNWWGMAKVKGGKIKLSVPRELSSEIYCELQNLFPLLNVYSSENKVPGIVNSLLSPEKVTASASIRLLEDSFSVPRFEVENGKLNIQGRVRLLSWEKRAVLLARYGAIAVGLERREDESRLVLHEAPKWFKKQRLFPPVLLSE